MERGYEKRLIFQPLGGLLGPVGEDEVGAGAAGAGEHFQDGLFLVEPAVLGGGFEHGVFAADVLAGDGIAELLFHASIPANSESDASRCSWRLSPGLFGGNVGQLPLLLLPPLGPFLPHRTLIVPSLPSRRLMNRLV